MAEIIVTGLFTLLGVIVGAAIAMPRQKKES
jgi:hypothetical protein